MKKAIIITILSSISILGLYLVSQPEQQISPNVSSLSFDGYISPIVSTQPVEPIKNTEQPVLFNKDETVLTTNVQEVQPDYITGSYDEVWMTVFSKVQNVDITNPLLVNRDGPITSLVMSKYDEKKNLYTLSNIDSTILKCLSYFDSLSGDYQTQVVLSMTAFSQQECGI